MKSIFLGEEITSAPPVKERVRAAFMAAGSVAQLAAIGALFGSKTGALVGAAIGSAAVNGIVTDGFLCGLMESKEEQAKIDSELLPKRIGLAIGGAAAAVLGGIALSSASKKHPIAGAVIGASLASGMVAATFVSTECPKPVGLSGTPLGTGAPAHFQPVGFP